MAEKLLKKAEKQTKTEINKIDQKNTTLVIRRDPFWFEKFNWFISSENILTVCGRDQQQNDLIFKKYLNPFDIYLHIDISSSPSCVIKTNWKSIPSVFPDQTIQEAAIFTMCHSKLWKEKHLGDIYWVFLN